MTGNNFFVPPLRALKVLAEAQALRFFCCDIIDLEDAIVPLLDFAARRDIEPELARQIIYRAFDLPPDGNPANHPRIEKYG